MKTVVITGADGFIGSHLVHYFADRGVEVYALVVKKSPVRHCIEHLKHVVVVEGDLTNRDSLIPALPVEADAFFHLAWAGVAPEHRNSIDIQMENVGLCISAARLAAAIGAKRFIMPGSTMEYMYSGGNINASSLPSPQNAYGAAKISARYLCQSLCEELALPFIYVVITGIYSADRTDNNVIYYTISSLLKGERPSLTKLEQLWDYVHIDDVVAAFGAVAEKGRPGGFYTIGHGDNWPLSNYIYQIRDIINPSLELGIGEVPYKNECLPSSCVDLGPLIRDTGFKPQIPFHEGIKEVIRVVRETMEAAK